LLPIRIVHFLPMNSAGRAREDGLMKRRRTGLSRLGVIVFLAAFAHDFPVTRAAAPGRPNIIIIMSDDMGFSDLGSYGGEVNTPNLDSLAAGGVRFTQFYNNARCCPTRASILTGLYPHQTGVGHMMEDRGHDGYRGDPNCRCVTIAEVLRPAGYATYAVGKWHVTPGQNGATLARTHNWPLQRGFDRYYGTIHGAGSFFGRLATAMDQWKSEPFDSGKEQPDTEFPRICIGGR